MVIAVWDSHMFMMVYLKMKLLAGDMVFHVFKPNYGPSIKTWWIFLALSVCLNLIGGFFYPFLSVSPSCKLKC